MDLQGGFHYIENEQNLRPSTLRDVSFSPDSQYVTYTANGLLKVLHIPSQKSKVFDVYPHLDEDESRYLIYGQEGVWILGSNDVRFLTRQLDENIVYETADELVHFFITDAEDKLLIIERRDRTYTLKLVPLFEDEEDTTGDGAHQFSTIKG